MSEIIDVQPAADQLRAFARWAVAQNPKIATASQSSFAVPADLFPVAPESVLVGALVDGHPYVPSGEDSAELLGVATAEGFTGYVHPEIETTPGEALPEVPPEAYGPDSVPLDFAPLEDAAAEDNDRSGDEDQADEDGFPCGLCERSLKTARGRDAHRRQAHRAD